MGIMDRMQKQAMANAMKTMEALKKDLQDIRDNQRELVDGVLSIYKAIECIAKKNKVKLPEPLIKMEIEE